MALTVRTGHTVTLDPRDLLAMPDYLDWLVRKVPLEHPDRQVLLALRGLRDRLGQKDALEFLENPDPQAL